jgi:hypothetical protein
MTPAWKQAVRAALADLGWNQSMLAKQAGVARSVVSAMLSEDQSSSDAVPLVCEALTNALGRPFAMPVLGVDDELAQVIDQLTPADREIILGHARRLLK